MTKDDKNKVIGFNNFDVYTKYVNGMPDERRFSVKKKNILRNVHRTWVIFARI